MEKFMHVDNPGHNAAFEFGFVQSIKFMLQKLTERVGTEPDPATGGHYVVIKPGVIINNEHFMFFAWKDLPPYAVTRHLYEINSFIQDQNKFLENLN